MRIEYHILWNNPETLLKVLFPTHYNGSHARFGSPFGSTLRSQQPGEPYDEAQWEVAASRWAMVADDGGQDGLFVVTEAKFGWTARSGVLGLSLLRSAALPVSGQGNIKDSTHRDFSDLKPHVIKVALGRFSPGAPREELPAALADCLHTRPVAYRGSPISSGFLGLQGGESLVPSWVKPGEDGQMDLRLHESLGRRGRATIKLAEGWTLRRTNLAGEVWPVQPRRNTFDFNPYEVITLRLLPD